MARPASRHPSVKSEGFVSNCADNSQLLSSPPPNAALAAPSGGARPFSYRRTVRVPRQGHRSLDALGPIPSVDVASDIHPLLANVLSPY